METSKYPFFNQFSREQIKKQYAKNAEGLKQMEEKALRTGKKVNGFTFEQLYESRIRFQELAK